MNLEESCDESFQKDVAYLQPQQVITVFLFGHTSPAVLCFILFCQLSLGKMKW
jgi:hypothetical protein